MITRIVKIEKGVFAIEYKRLDFSWVPWKTVDKTFKTKPKVSEELEEEIPKSLNVVADYARRQVEELLSVIKKYNDYSEEQIEELRTHLMAMFLEGAGWQKEQMMKDCELLKEWFEEIAEKCGRLTSGNVSHLGKTIRGLAYNSAEYIETDILCEKK